MKKILSLLAFLFVASFISSCENPTDDIADNDNINVPGDSNSDDGNSNGSGSGDNNSGGNIYVAGFVSDGAGNTTACYWKNGERVDLFTGELEDLVVVDGTVYSVGWTYGGSSYYWVGNESFKLEGSGAEAYAIAVHDGDVYTTGRSSGACYWKNTKKTSLSGGDSSGYGISVSDDGDVFVGGYYQNNHHYVIPAKWENGNRSNLSRPSGGDGEVQDVLIVDGTPYFFGMTMKPDNQVGLVSKASYWHGNNRTDLTNGGGFDEMIDGGEAFGGFVDGSDIYVAGKISQFGQYCADCPNNTKPGTGGDTAYYWYNGNKFDLPGGVWTDGWTSTAYDIAVKDDLTVASGYVATGTETQVPAIWINGELTKLEGDNTYGVAKAVFID
ncbi:MAG: hypothetical protein ACPHPL_06225 [Flavobacteriaceae bacterium]